MEDRLPLMLTHLNVRAREDCRLYLSLSCKTFLTQNNMELLYIRDIQLRPTPMEEVFMTITKKAELENAEVRPLTDYVFALVR